MSELVVNITKTVNAPVERVFDAWLTAETLSKFMLPAPGMPEPYVEIDAREGGRFTIIMQVGEQKIPHTGTYLEVSRSSRLVFSWESPRSVDESIVTLEFKSEGKNKTVVELTHVKFLDESARTDHENGWSNILEKLAEVFS